MPEHTVQVGQLYESCQPVFVVDGKETHTRLRVTAYTPGAGRADVVDAVTGGRPRSILTSALHATATTETGRARRTGYRLVADVGFDSLVASSYRTCTACPTQYEGTLKDGRWFYFRYRGGRATLGVGATEHDAVEDPDTASERIGDGLDGFLDEDEYRQVFTRLASRRLAEEAAGA